MSASELNHQIRVIAFLEAKSIEKCEVSARVLSAIKGQFFLKKRQRTYIHNICHEKNMMTSTKNNHMDQRIENLQLIERQFVGIEVQLLPAVNCLLRKGEAPTLHYLISVIKRAWSGAFNKTAPSAQKRKGEVEDKRKTWQSFVPCA